MSDYNIVMPFIQGFVSFALLFVGAFAIIGIVYLVYGIIKDERMRSREQIKEGYEAAELIGCMRVETSEITGVLYSYSKGE